MATLFDALQQKLTPGDPAVVSPEQERIQKALQAKSGKATTATGPKASALGENQAIAQAGAQLAQVQQAGTAAAGQIAAGAANLQTQDRVFQAGQAAEARGAADQLAVRGTAATEALAARETQARDQRGANEGLKIQSINAEAERTLKSLATQRDIEVDSIFAEFEHSNKELEFRRDAAKIEQLGHLIALQDRAYMDEIDRIGRERSLEDEIAFKEEMFRLTFGNELSDMTDQLMWQTKYNADQRTYERELAKIDAGAALQFAEAAIRDANRQAIAQGATDAAREGLDAYGTHYKPSKTTTGGTKTSGTDGEVAYAGGGSQQGYR